MNTVMGRPLDNPYRIARSLDPVSSVGWFTTSTASDSLTRLLGQHPIDRRTLHAARHTCATLMHLQGVPAAVIAAWIGHKDASLTMRLYAHCQDDALKAAGATLDRVVTSCDTDTG